MENKTIFVAGITGRQGGAVAKNLLKNGWKVRGMTRSPQGKLALKLKAIGVEIVEGDMKNLDSLVRIMEGCYGVYSLQNYFEGGADQEVLYGKNMAMAAKKAGIQHFVYGSVQACDQKTGVEHFETKHQIENIVKSMDLPFTMVRAVAFMENYYILDVYKRLIVGQLVDALPANKPFQLIAIDDLGKYVAAIFARKDLIGKTIDVAGATLTNTEVVNTFSEVMGKRVKFMNMPMPLARLLMGKDLYRMFKWFAQSGFSADLAATRKLIPEVQPLNLEQWLLAENWDRWNKKGAF